MIEKEQPEGLSARKLVVETAKHNVLTAYDAEAGLELLRRFPKVDVILVHGDLLDQDNSLLARVKSIAPDKPIILVSPFVSHPAPEATYCLDSHQPAALLKLFAEQF
jgi:DNA-binding response OmpR family regulator